MSSAWLAILVGILYTAGVYMMLRRSVVKLLIGIALLSHAANLLVFSAGGVVRGRPPIVDGGAPAGVADPLPQALVLTAIVIGFGVLAFAIALLHRVHQETGSDDVEHLDGRAS
jgi:multicomponent Na+:H+ antiporter subunit C